MWRIWLSAHWNSLGQDQSMTPQSTIHTERKEAGKLFSYISLANKLFQNVIICIWTCLIQDHVLSSPSRDHGDKEVWRASWKTWTQAKRRRVNLQQVHFRSQISEWNLTQVVLVLTSGCEDDCQIDGIAKLAPIVAFYAGKPEMLEKVEAAVRVTQNNDACVAETLAAARWVGSLCVVSLVSTGVQPVSPSLLNYPMISQIPGALHTKWAWPKGPGLSARSAQWPEQEAASGSG